MKVFNGSSNENDARKAVIEATAEWPIIESKHPEMIFVFHSSRQDSDEISRALAERFPNSLIAGCTSAGEWQTGIHQTQSLILSGISSTNIRWALEVVESLDEFDEEIARNIYKTLLGKLGVEPIDVTPENLFCIGFTDGWKGVDGSIIATMSNVLGNVPFLGGVAGDDFLLVNTYVIANESAISGGAVFILAESDEPFSIFEHQQFVPGSKEMVITEANVAEKRVYHMDGKPAAKYFANLICKTVEELNFQVFAENPVISLHGRESYVRTIYKSNEDGSLTFCCTIEEGMVLHLCEQRDMVSEMKRCVSELINKSGKGKLLMIFNSSCRAFEAETKKQNRELAMLMADAASHVVGFDTYEEQWNGLQMNQNLVGLSIGVDK